MRLILSICGLSPSGRRLGEEPRGSRGHQTLTNPRIHQRPAFHHGFDRETTHGNCCLSSSDPPGLVNDGPKRDEGGETKDSLVDAGPASTTHALYWMCARREATAGSRNECYLARISESMNSAGG
jgi:hypothetical protein